jgi:translation elongation factor P/translation initiation factor 5A
MGAHKICQEGRIIAAKIVVYHGDDDEYFSFMTAEAYHQLERWIEYRQDCGEKINDDTWVMRQLWNTAMLEPQQLTTLS